MRRGPKIRFGEYQTEQLNISLTPDMMRLIESQAREVKVSTVDYARTILLKELVTVQEQTQGAKQSYEIET